MALWAFTFTGYVRAAHASRKRRWVFLRSRLQAPAVRARLELRVELLAQGGELRGGPERLQPALGDAALAVLRSEEGARDGAVGVGVAAAGHDGDQAFLEGGGGGERAEGDLHGAQDVT